jgi:hypothetical protein
MFYPPRNPEETGICALDLVDEGEWEGPIAPGSGMQQPAVARPEPKIQTPPPPPRVVETFQLARSVKEADAMLMKEVLAWFVTLGAEYLPQEIHQTQLIDLAKMLAPAFGVKTPFTSINDVIGFMMDRSQSPQDELLRN